MRLAKKCAILHDQAGECIPSLCKMRHQCNEATVYLTSFERVLRKLFYVRHNAKQGKYQYSWTSINRVSIGIQGIQDILWRVALRLKEK